ncbi:hypothetical protein KKG71_01205, partial [Patescibacteria group bacterium]|nr:hypothetical protein [Patescibacteria group bacterium]
MKKIQTQLIVILLLIGLLPVLIVGYIFLSTTQDAIRQDRSDQLYSIAQKTSHAISWGLEEQKEKIRIVGDIDLFQDALTADSLS